MKKYLAPTLSIMLAIALPILGGCSSDADRSDDTRTSPGVVDDSLQGVRVSVVDVGKGDCILVQVGGRAALIDTGYDSTSSEVVSYLREQGVERLDWLVITHYDRDHVGGIWAVGKAFDIDAVYLPGYKGADKQYRTAMADIDAIGYPAQPVTRETAFGFEGAQVTILPTSLSYIPNANGNEGNDNDLSLVVELTFGEDSYLFAGDLEEEGIDAYLDGEPGHYDVLKVPHHGEKAANTDELLTKVEPEIAIITDSAEDPADKKTLKLLKKAEADTYRTSECGTVVVESTGTGSYSVSAAE